MKSVKYKKLYEDSIEPMRGTEYSAGFDLHAHVGDEAVGVPIGETVMIGSGISIAIPNGFFGAVFARSGLSTKKGLRPANCVGVIDSDYRGEIYIPIYNDSDQWQYINDGDRVAQLIIIPYYKVNLEEVDDLDNTERGNGGFGSTGESG